MRKIQNEELGRLSVDDFKQAEKRPVAVVLDDVRSLNNIGSVFRTADAFRCQSVLLCGITATPPHREIHKTALGAEDSVQWQYFPTVLEAVQHLKSNGFKIIVIEQVEGSISLEKFSPVKDIPYAFIFGNEVYGVSQEIVNLADHAIEIPQQGTKHSLNIAVSAGIVLWDYVSKTGVALGK